MKDYIERRYRIKSKEIEIEGVKEIDQQILNDFMNTAIEDKKQHLNFKKSQ